MTGKNREVGVVREGEGGGRSKRSAVIRTVGGGGDLSTKGRPSSSALLEVFDHLPQFRHGLQQPISIDRTGPLDEPRVRSDLC